jgi:Holliday junction resolvase RusA-like endonuclease
MTAAVFTGKAVGVNRWHMARTIKIKNRWQARIFENPEYRQFKNFLVALFRKSMAPTSGYVDISITMWRHKAADSDGIIKPIFDALEDAGIVADDKLIRNVSVFRHYHKIKEQDMIMIELFPVPEDFLTLIVEEQLKGYSVEPGQTI